ANGKKITEDAKKTAGAAFGIRLTPHTAPGGLQANGSDVEIVDVEVIDRQGNRCPTALNLINFQLDGPGEWRGGIAQGKDNYILSKSLPVENGVNRVLIRSTTKTGTIRLNATSDKLEPVSLLILSQ